MTPGFDHAVASRHLASMPSLQLRWRLPALGIIISLLSLLLLACQEFGEKRTPASKAKPRLVILYATCTLNKNYLFPYNPKVTYTPNIRMFSKEAIVFDKHRTEAGLSGVAFASIFSGLQAVDHGIFTHPTPLDDSTYLISEAFSDNSYDVFFWNFHKMASAELNYAQATPTGNIVTRPLTIRYPDQGSVLDFLTFDNKQAAEIAQRLATDPDYRALVIVTFSLTHGNYVNRIDTFCKNFPAECDALNAIDAHSARQYVNHYYENAKIWSYNYPHALNDLSSKQGVLSEMLPIVDLLYRSNVNFLDSVFGRLLSKLNALGISEQTLLVFTADHGETFFKEGAPFKWCHGHTVQGDVLDVPLIIRFPRSKIRPHRVDYVTRSIDLLPTVASLADLTFPDDTLRRRDSAISGRDLSPVLRNEEAPPDLPAYSHSAVLPPAVLDLDKDITAHLLEFYPETDISLTWVAVRQQDMVWKYRNIDGQEWRFQAFDLEKDASESFDVYDTEDPLHVEMADRLKRYKATLTRAYEHWAGARADDISESEKAEILRSLGYI